MKEFSEKSRRNFIRKAILRAILSLMKKMILFFVPIFLFFAFFFPAETFAQSIPSDSTDLASRKLPPKRPSPTRPMNFNGRRMPNRSENFSVIGLKIEEAGDFLVISMYVNEAVNANSVRSESIFINDEPLPRKTEFLFNKTRHMIRFSAPKTDGTFSLKLTALRSFDGKAMNPTEITNAQANSFFKYERKENTWQKSSL